MRQRLPILKPSEKRKSGRKKKFSEPQCYLIRVQHGFGRSKRYIARRLGVHHGTIMAVINRTGAYSG